MTQIYNRPCISSLLDRPTIHEAQHVKLPYISRGFRNSDEYPTRCNSNRQHEGNDWKLSQSHSLTPDNNKNGLDEVSGPITGDMYQTKSEPAQKPAREQLPPLSSLFGTSISHHSRSTQSPYSDRHSPVFPATSPLDSRHPAKPVHLDRPQDGPYLQRPSTSHQHSYRSRPERVENLGLQLPPRPTPSGPRTESPRYEIQSASSEVSRTQSSNSTTNAWLSQSNHPRPEYFSRDISSSYRPHPEQRPQQAPSNGSEQDQRAAYLGHDGLAPVTPTYPPTPGSTVAGDTTVIKDGLGPKIWTGTQFLPRFVRQAEVPGEGLCYFYDDGTHCRTVIDGEAVNAHWGVTKAGKPRKRLAIACITCREKKIKCDPDYPRCVQCEKFGRICKFKNA